MGIVGLGGIGAVKSNRFKYKEQIGYYDKMSKQTVFATVIGEDDKTYYIKYQLYVPNQKKYLFLKKYVLRNSKDLFKI